MLLLYLLYFYIYQRGLANSESKHSVFSFQHMQRDRSAHTHTLSITLGTFHKHTLISWRRTTITTGVTVTLRQLSAYHRKENASPFLVSGSSLSVFLHLFTHFLSLPDPSSSCLCSSRSSCSKSDIASTHICVLLLISQHGRPRLLSVQTSNIRAHFHGPTEAQTLNPPAFRTLTLTLCVKQNYKQSTSQI